MTPELAFERVTLRIRTRSRQEKELARSLLCLRTLALPSDGAGLFVYTGPPAEMKAPLMAQHLTVPVAMDDNSVEVMRPQREPLDVTRSEVDEVPVPRASGPFDDLFEAVTRSSGWPNRPLPRPSRFMVRVAAVPKPHRATKRDYDYFTELNAALAAKARETSPSSDE
jgi:hypothetical protein